VGSYLSFAAGGGSAVAVKLANFLRLFAGVFVIAAGASLARRRRSDVAAGAFLAAAIILAVHVVAGLLETTEGWVWQTFAVLALQAVEIALLLLAASRARREGQAATS
jgi:hypothetical protein